MTDPDTTPDVKRDPHVDEMLTEHIEQPRRDPKMFIACAATWAAAATPIVSPVADLEQQAKIANLAAENARLRQQRDEARGRLSEETLALQSIVAERDEARAEAERLREAVALGERTYDEAVAHFTAELDALRSSPPVPTPPDEGSGT